MASLRLVRIEARRSVAIWLMPFTLLLGVLWARNELVHEIPMWTESSILARNIPAMVAPVLGGIAAWIAGRARRRGAEDLLGTVPLPFITRELATWGGALVWGWAAAALAIAGLFALTLQRGAWGAPFYWPVAVGALTLFASSAIGFTMGRLFPSRWTPPLAAGVVFAIYFPPRQLQYLSPVYDNPYREVFFGLRPGLGVPVSLLLTGIGVAALSVLALKSERKVLGAVVLAGALALASVGGAMAAYAGENDVPYVMEGQPKAGEPLPIHWLLEPTPYELMCSGVAFKVCVHPAYDELLQPLVEGYSALAAPLQGVPGAPQSAEQVPYALAVEPLYAVYRFGLHPGSMRSVESPGQWNGAALGFVSSPNRLLDGVSGRDASAYAARSVIAAWLCIQAGVPLEWPVPGGGTQRNFSVEAQRRAEDFASLDPAVRRAWLEENFAALRAGGLTLEDLP